MAMKQQPLRDNNGCKPLGAGQKWSKSAGFKSDPVGAHVMPSSGANSTFHTWEAIKEDRGGAARRCSPVRDCEAEADQSGVEAPGSGLEASLLSHGEMIQ